MKFESEINKLPAMDEDFLLLRTPEPPYVAVISTNINSAKEQEAYDQSMQEMLAIVKDLPGFLGIESSGEVLDDGRIFKLGVVYWKDMVSLDNWRNHEQHMATKIKGKKTWYDEHNIRVCQVVKQYGSNLTQGKSDQLAFNSNSE